MGFCHWQPGQVCFFSSTEASVPVPGAGPDCHAPRLAAPGPDRSTGVLGSWSQGRRRSQLPEGHGRRGYPPGKVRRGCQLAPQVHGHGRCPDGYGWGGVGQGGCNSRGWTWAVYIPGFSLDHPFRIFLCLASLWDLCSLALPSDFNQGLCK